MKIHLDYRNANTAHCDVAVFINGANCGTLKLGQEDVVGFQQIVSAGCAKGIDSFIGTGKSLPPDDEERARDAVCKCGHYASAHNGPTCNGWMPNGAGHSQAACLCGGFR